jgi:C4-type Zn-finger protein
VTVLARLADAFARLTEATVVPVCVECRLPMVLQRESPVGTFVVEQVYACERCGWHVTRVQPWAIPD